MKSIQILLASVILMAFTISMNAQDYAGAFSWVNPSASNMSVASINACGVQNNVQMNTSSATHKLSGTSVIIPAVPSDDATTVVTITLNFFVPVCNLRIKLNDIDYGPVTSTGGGPIETVTTSPTYVNLTPSFSPPGPFYNDVSGTITPPFGVDNTLGWVEFGAAPLSTVTFTYNREEGYGIYLDSMTYECCNVCICDNPENHLIEGTGSIPNSGATTVGVSLNSSGVPIRKLNVSLPYYTSLANPECIKCDAENISSYGKITNLPTIAGVTPTFTGPTATGSAEIVYEFTTPTIINHDIALDVQFPPTLDLDCCDNRVDYCIKLGMIDEQCRICEQLLCLPNSSTGSNSGSGGNTGRATPDSDNSKATLDGPQRTGKLILKPNPATNTLNVTLPSEEQATLEILDLNGKNIQSKNVSSTATTLDVSRLIGGTYILKYSSGETVLSERFVKVND